MLTTNDSQSCSSYSSPGTRRKMLRKLQSPSRLMRKASVGLRLKKKLFGRRKLPIPKVSYVVVQDLDVLRLRLKQSIDETSPSNLQPLWEPSKSVAIHLPIQLSKSDISLLPAFRHTGMLLHRPAGFGKTTFLEELGQFCDVCPHSNGPDDKTPKYFTSECTKNPFVVLHQTKYLMLHFDLSNLLLGTSDTFTEAGFRDCLLSEIRGSLDKYMSKYSANGSLSLPLNGYPTLSLMHICHLLPCLSDHSTFITVDNYDAPFLNAPPGKLMIVERVIEELLYGNVLLAFRQHSSKHKLIVMGSGIRDYHAPAESIADLLGLVDCTRDPCVAGLVGLTVAEIKGALQEVVEDEDEAMRFALLKEIENTCWRESFAEESFAEESDAEESDAEESDDVSSIVCSREVTVLLANRTKSRITL